MPTTHSNRYYPDGSMTGICAVCGAEVRGRWEMRQGVLYLLDATHKGPCKEEKK